MEGAGFDMDFSNIFATIPQQQPFTKPNEDNTSSFFFGDEGIDTNASFIDPNALSTPSQSMSYIPQNLVGMVVSCDRDRILTTVSLWITLWTVLQCGIAISHQNHLSWTHLQ